MAQIKRDTTGPVTLEQLKNHLHMFINDFDADLEMKLKAAVAKAENYISSRIWSGTLSVSVPFVNTIVIDEPSAQLIQVKVDGQEVNHMYLNGVLTVEGNGKVLEYTMQVGYTAEECPADIQMAILLIAAKMFNNPVDSVENLPSASQNMLHPYKHYHI